jgi:serine 3-dehydrogenase (NADP+)
MSVSLKDQSVLILGASSGIGRAAALMFANEGARVLASARRQDRLEQLRAESGGRIAIHAADAGDADQVTALVAAAGKVDVMVYATGTNTPDRALTRLTDPIWHELIQVNLNGAWYITRALLPAMRAAKHGHLIYVSSISGRTPDVSGAAYQASKRGMLGLAHAVRMEEKQHQIRTCVICPGLVDTELIEKRPVKPTAETLAQALKPEDVAEAILFVAKLPERAAVPEMELMPTTL